MYRFYINNVDSENIYNELIRVFLGDKNHETIPGYFDPVFAVLIGNESYLINSSSSNNKDEIKREIYRLLSDITGKKPPWGILTGVRPLKLAYNKYLECRDLDNVKDMMKSEYLLSEKKAEILKQVLAYQVENVSLPESDKVSLYLGIPFCPTRCSYCSFAATDMQSEDDVCEYLEALNREIRVLSDIYKKNRVEIESVYIGGGTPTVLNEEQLTDLCSELISAFCIDTSKVEFTVEAGRPDTIDDKKLSALKVLGIDRVSINPQTMHDKTLKLIGRDHSTAQTREAFEIVKKAGIRCINSDLIAGLPGEDLNDFKESLNEIIKLGADNITIHTLSIKRGSRLREEAPEYYLLNAELVEDMLDYAHSALTAAGFFPYYIYRQKHQTGALENIGYCKKGTHSMYNIRIMEEKQSILALGAGGIGKVYNSSNTGFKRIANVKNYRVYIDRIDEMLERKKGYEKER